MTDTPTAKRNYRDIDDPNNTALVKMTDTPNPGSKEAIDKGCTCPVLDNGHGRGYMGQKGIFVITNGCPIHAPRKEQP